MLEKNEVKTLQDAIAKHKRPFYFFHDDPDGLASFLLFYRAIQEGKGYCLKAYPRLTSEHARHVTNYGADSVFVFDIAIVDQEFIDEITTPIYWIDHHQQLERKGINYFNPRTRKITETSTTAMCWQATRKQRPQDLWIATVGAISDWHFPDFAKKLQKQNPKLLPLEITTPEQALFNSPLGTLVKVFSFNLKGPTNEVNTSIKILTRIESPEEILKQTTPRGKKLWKKYRSINNTYETMLKTAAKTTTKNKILVHTYSHEKISLTKDLANELLYQFPEKTIVVGRKKNGEVRCSLRAPKGVRLDKALEKALVGVQGYGGGHEQACGAGIKEEDFERFIENLRRELSL